MALVAKGLEGIIANESKLSNVQGLEGKLCYLGYTIDDLVEHTSFEEVIYLLHNGKLPNRSELDGLISKLKADRNLPDGIIDFLKNAPKDLDPWMLFAQEYQ
jgi:citrate synthase